MKQPVNKCSQPTWNSPGDDGMCCLHEADMAKPLPGSQQTFTTWRCCRCNMFMTTYHGSYAPITPYPLTTT